MARRLRASAPQKADRTPYTVETRIVPTRVRCALCKAELTHRPGRGNAAEALTRHYQEKHPEGK